MAQFLSIVRDDKKRLLRVALRRDLADSCMNFNACRFYAGLAVIYSYDQEPNDSKV